ncbi:MAG TPA: hypothetical protein VN659_15030 [Pyrinomonadaceae bacterium]|nr:hypothetical protein [Pyrinomonadaceae bacterium]
MSDEMRFCSRCGLALTGLAEWLAGGRMQRVEQTQVTEPSPRRKHLRRAAKLMFVSGVLFPIFFALCAAIDEGGPMFIPCFVLFVSLVWLLYARLFISNTPIVNYQAAQTLGSMSARTSLPPATTSIPVGRAQVRTNELAQPPSVTENTTRFFDTE